MSANFFKRYSVDAEEIERAGKKKKEFDVQRVVTECDYERDQLDRRIVFEMIGSRIEEEDFPDETSESEAGDDDGELVEILSLAEEVNEFVPARSSINFEA